jgi:hypothetical protein
LNGACQPGSTAAACGKQGASCSACQANQICRVDQTCGVDPDSTWLLQPSSASIKSTNNGASWDGDGSAPDPRVALQCPAGVAGQAFVATNTTAEVSDSYHPTWTTGGCSMKARDLLSSGFTYQLIDVDPTSDDTITQPYIVKPNEAVFVTGSFALPGADGMDSLTFVLQRQ